MKMIAHFSGYNKRHPYTRYDWDFTVSHTPHDNVLRQAKSIGKEIITFNAGDAYMFFYGNDTGKHYEQSDY